MFKTHRFISDKNVKMNKKKIDALTNFDLKRIEHQDGEDAKLAEKNFHP